MLGEWLIISDGYVCCCICEMCLFACDTVFKCVDEFFLEVYPLEVMSIRQKSHLGQCPFPGFNILLGFVILLLWCLNGPTSFPVISLHYRISSKL